MSKYTAERVLEYVEKAERGYFNPVHMEMLRDYAALLRERESVKVVVVTDDIFEAFDAAQTKAMGEYEMQQYHAGKESHLVNALDFATRAALEAVAPMLVSARVPEVSVAMVREAEHTCPTDRPHMDKLRWKAAKLNELLAAASKPETEG